ncbi:maleylpyruvate isomerase N-terminal domain-containing protein [Mariniluteicoccus endophyticus]
MLTVDLTEARKAFLGALAAFFAAADRLDDHALLGPSRAYGWSRLDCLVHVRVGLEEMLAGTPALTDAGPTVDAASYWTAWGADADDDPVPGILWTRRTASAYARPRDVLEHLGMVVAGLEGAAAAMPDAAVRFQGHVLTTGDFLATWAVELTVHHLDLDLPGDSAGPDPAALRLARRTAEALGGDATAGDDDVRAVLRGFGRA